VARTNIETRCAMNLTDYHAKYFAHELTKRSPSDSVEALAGVLADAQVDLNPHQIEAALFAFQNPFSRGAILADEVGLGKTIEAGLLLSQRWAERKRKLLIIVPANLRKQWSQELSDKFHLPSVIMESRSFNEAIRDGNLNPFVQNSIVLCSYQFVRSKEPYLRQVAWDLVVIDEAHRLRNVYKTSSRIALAIKNAVAAFPKVLLTATPLQNSLLELYWLVSIIDEYTFGDLKSFRSRFARLGNQSDFTELKERLKPVPVSIARTTSCFSSGVLPRSHAASRRSSSPSSRRRLRPCGTLGRRTIFTGFRGSHRPHSRSAVSMA
jgi:SNF2 family DNA or RNA helicase